VSAAEPGPIAYVVKMFPRLSETFITNEITELRRRGVPIRIVSLLPAAQAVDWPNARALGDSAFVLPDPDTREGAAACRAAHARLFRRHPGRWLSIAVRAGRHLSSRTWKRFLQAGPLSVLSLDENIPHFHAGFAHAPASVVLWASRLTGRSWSLAAHAKDLYLSEPASLRRKLGAARFVWTCTETNGAHLRELSGETPVHVGYHGVDLAFWSAPSISRLPDRILAVGRLVPKKGFDDLLRAAAKLAARGVPFTLDLVGDGPERARLESLANELGLNERVMFKGAMPADALRALYARAAVFALPCVQLPNGDRDGIPNVLVEAMAAGTPVVATRVSGIPELIAHERTGLLAPARDPAALADAIGEVLSHPQSATRRAIAARADVEVRFDLSKNAARLAELLQRHRRPNRALYVTLDRGIPVRGHKGASAHVRQIASRLADAGCDVRVLATNAGDGPAATSFSLPVQIVPAPAWSDRLLARLPGRSHPGFRGSQVRPFVEETRRLLTNLSAAPRLLEILRSWRPDFVYERYSLVSVAIGWLCLRRGVPWIVEVNAPLADEEKRYRTLRLERITRWAERWVIRRADHLFVVSPALRRWALGLGAHPDRVSVLPNGVDTRRFHTGVDGHAVRAAWGFRPDDVVVAFAGSLKPWHGCTLLLESFVRARQRIPGLRLVYIGDGPERKSLERLVRRSGLEDEVRLTGALPQDAVPAALRAADILAAPYLSQADFYFSPLKVLEYMAVGRAIIASRLGEMVDLLSGEGDDIAGELLPPGSVAAWADAIVALAEHPDRRRALGAVGASRAHQHDWSTRAAQIRRRAETIRGLRSSEPSLRIGYVLKMFPRFSETFVVNEIVELERQGVDVRVFSMKRPSGPRQEASDSVWAQVTVLAPRGVRSVLAAAAAHLRCLARSPRRYGAALGFALGRRDLRAMTKFAQAGVIADACALSRIDHLHAHFASGPARVAKFASMISSLPFSFTAHAKDLYWGGHHHDESHKLKKRVRLARFVVTVSRENQRFVESLGFRVKVGRIRPIYIGLRLGDFPFTPPSLRPRSPRPLVLAVGRLIEKKGFHHLIEALAQLRAEGIPFRCAIAGEGPEQTRLRALIDARGLRGTVHLLGAVPLTRLRLRYYSRARVLAQPCVVATDGDRDGIPTVLLEAMALGVPVISTSVSGIPEAIEDGVDGFLVPPGDVEALATRLRTLLLESAVAERFALAGRTRVGLQFDQRQNAGILRKLFERSRRGWPALEATMPTTESATDWPGSEMDGAIAARSTPHSSPAASYVR